MDARDGAAIHRFSEHPVGGVGGLADQRNGAVSLFSAAGESVTQLVGDMTAVPDGTVEAVR